MILVIGYMTIVYRSMPRTIPESNAESH